MVADQGCGGAFGRSGADDVSRPVGPKPQQPHTPAYAHQTPAASGGSSSSPLPRNKTTAPYFPKMAAAAPAGGAPATLRYGEMKVNDVSGKDNLCAFQAVSAAVNKYYGRDLSVKCTLGQDLYTIVDPVSYPKMLEMREVLVETARRLEEWAHSPAPADESEYDQGLRPLIQQAFPRGRHLQIRAGGQVDHHELDAVNTIVSRLQGLVPPNMQTLRATADYRRSYANPSSAPTNPAATYEPWQAAIPNPDERAYITLLYVRSNHFQQVERRLKNGDLTPWLGDASPSDISLKVMAAAEAAVEEYLASGAAAFPELWPAVSAVGRERAAREREQRHSMRELVAGAAGAGSGGRQQKMIKQLQEAAGGGWAAQKDADKKREQEQQKQRAAAAAVEAWRRRQEEQARRAAEAKAKAAAAGVPQQHQMIQLRAQQHEQYTKQKRGRRLAFGGAGDEEEGDDKDDARAAPLLGSFLPAPARPYAGSPLPESSNVFDGLIDVDEEMVQHGGDNDDDSGDDGHDGASGGGGPSGGGGSSGGGGALGGGNTSLDHSSDDDDDDDNPGRSYRGGKKNRGKKTGKTARRRRQHARKRARANSSDEDDGEGSGSSSSDDSDKQPEDEGVDPRMLAAANSHHLYGADRTLFLDAVRAGQVALGQRRPKCATARFDFEGSNLRMSDLLNRLRKTTAAEVKPRLPCGLAEDERFPALLRFLDTHAKAGRPGYAEAYDLASTLAGEGTFSTVMSPNQGIHFLFQSFDRSILQLKLGNFKETIAHLLRGRDAFFEAPFRCLYVPLHLPDAEKITFIKNWLDSIDRSKFEEYERAGVVSPMVRTSGQRSVGIEWRAHGFLNEPGSRWFGINIVRAMRGLQTANEKRSRNTTLKRRKLMQTDEGKYVSAYYRSTRMQLRTDAATAGPRAELFESMVSNAKADHPHLRREDLEADLRLIIDRRRRGVRGKRSPIILDRFGWGKAAQTFIENNPVLSGRKASIRCTQEFLLGKDGFKAWEAALVDKWHGSRRAAEDGGEGDDESEGSESGGGEEEEAGGGEEEDD